MREKIMVILAVCFMIFGCTACEKDVDVVNSSANMVNGGAMIKCGDWIYWAGARAIFRCRTDGSEMEEVYRVDEEKCYVSKPQIEGKWIYFRTRSMEGDSVCKIRTDGTKFEVIYSVDNNSIDSMLVLGDQILLHQEELITTDGDYVKDIYDRNSGPNCTVNLVNDWIYFLDDDDHGKSGIYRMKTDGSALEKIYDGLAIFLVVDEDGEWIYFSNFYKSNHLYKMKTDGSEVQCLSDAYTMEINLYDDWVIYEGSYDGDACVYKMKTDGTDNQILIRERVDSLYVIDDYVYYEKNSGHGDIYRVNVEGGEPELFYEELY